MSDGAAPDAGELAGASILACMRSCGAWPAGGSGAAAGGASPPSERSWWSGPPLEAAPLPLFRPRASPAAVGAASKALSASSPAASSGSSSGTVAYSSWEETSRASDAPLAASVAASRGRRKASAAAGAGVAALCQAASPVAQFAVASPAFGAASPASPARSASPAPETPRLSPAAAPAAPASPPPSAAALAAQAAELQARAQASSAASASAPAPSPPAPSRLRAGARAHSASSAAGARGVHKTSGAASAIHARRSYTWRGVRRPRTPDGRSRRVGADADGAAAGAPSSAPPAAASGVAGLCAPSPSAASAPGASPLCSSALPGACAPSSPLGAGAEAVDPREGDKEWAALTTWLRMNLHNPRTPRKLVLFVGSQDASTKRWRFSLNPDLEWADVSPDTRARLSNLLEEARTAFRRKYPGRHPDAWVRKSQKYRPPGSTASYQVTLGDLVTSLAEVYERHERAAAQADAHRA